MQLSIFDLEAQLKVSGMKCNLKHNTKCDVILFLFFLNIKNIRNHQNLLRSFC